MAMTQLNTLAETAVISTVSSRVLFSEQSERCLEIEVPVL